MRNFAFCLGLILAMSLTDAQVDPCLTDMVDTVIKCFEKEKLNLITQKNFMNIFNDALRMDPNSQCQNTTLYKSALNCTMNEMRICYIKIHPTFEDPIEFNKLSQGIDVFCSKLGNFDVGCFKKELGPIEQCEKEGIRGLREDGLLPEDEMNATCMLQELSYDCFSSRLSRCSLETKKIYLEQLDSYQAAEACMRPGRTDRFSYINQESSIKNEGGNNSCAYYLVLFLGVISYMLLI